LVVMYPSPLLLHRKWANRKGRSNTGGFNLPIEGLPELIAACDGKESVFAAIVGQEFESSQIAEVRVQIVSHQEHKIAKICTLKNVD